jgi:DNA invertase Pin-like site-specific DNA recombinase
VIKHDADVKRLTLEGKTRQEIADELGITLSTVDNSRKRAGVKSHAPYQSRGGQLPSYTPEQRAEVIGLTKAGVGRREIESRTGVTLGVVDKIRKAEGLTKPHAITGLAPLAERLDAARQMVEDGAPFSEIKNTLHLSGAVLHRAFPGKAWTAEQCIEMAIAVRQANRQIRKNGLDIHSVDL